MMPFSNKGSLGYNGAQAGTSYENCSGVFRLGLGSQLGVK